MPSDPPPVPPPGAPDGSAAPPEVTRPDVARFATPRRLHPASVVVGVNVRQLLQAFLLPVAATFPAGGRVTLTVLAFVGLVGLVVRTLAWQRFDYSFDGEVLRVNEGVLRRNHRALDVARIQQVEVDRTFVQRLLGLAALRVETAGSSSEVEVELRVVPEGEARALRAAVREGQARVSPTEPGDGDPATAAARSSRQELLRVPLRHVVIASVTGVRLLVFPAVIAGAFQLAGQNLDDWLDRIVPPLVELGMAGPDSWNGTPITVGLLLAAGVLALSLVTAVAVGVLRDANFRIHRVDDDLHVSRGLLSTRDSVLPLRRLQLVQVQRNWLRRLLGFAAVRIHSAGGSADGDRRVTVPLVRATTIDALVGDLYPGAAGVPQLVSHPRNARRRSVFRWLRSGAYPIAAVWLLPFAWLEPFRWPVLGLLPVTALLGVVEYRQLAHGASDRIVASRQGALSVTTSLAPLVKVQAVSTRANWFQRRLGLATVVAHVAGPGGDVEVLDTATATAVVLHARLTDHAADPATNPTGGL